MSTAKRLALIAVGYALSVAGGLAAVAINEWRMPADIAAGSPGMVAFGDMILFVLATGVFSLVPTWFLLRLLVDKSPRTLLAIVLIAAAIGPVSWLAVLHMAGTPPAPNQAHAAGEMLGVLIAFGAIPRIVGGPVLLLIEGVTFLLVCGRTMRALLAAAMLMDIIPLSMFALHMAKGILR
jgi:hypothetical protein